MIFSLATFIISGLAIVLFLWLKLHQEKTGKLLLFSDHRSKIERHLKNSRDILREKKQQSIQALPHLPRRALNASKAAIVAFEKKIDSKTRNLPSLVRGRQVLTKSGKASDHLQAMTDARNGVVSGQHELRQESQEQYSTEQ